MPADDAPRYELDAPLAAHVSSLELLLQRELRATYDQEAIADNSSRPRAAIINTDQRQTTRNEGPFPPSTAVARVPAHPPRRPVTPRCQLRCRLHASDQRCTRRTPPIAASSRQAVTWCSTLRTSAALYESARLLSLAIADVLQEATASSPRVVRRGHPRLHSQLFRKVTASAFYRVYIELYCRLPTRRKQASQMHARSRTHRPTRTNVLAFLT